MRVLFYISGHGFGHAARAAQVMNALAGIAPSVRLSVRTAVPEWFLRASIDAPFDLARTETDAGVAQIGGLDIDEAETARRALAFDRTFRSRVDAEREAIRASGASLIVSDVAPLAIAAAVAARAPAVLLSNFTWDWIYAGMPGFDAAAPGVRARIAEAYASAQLALRLPFAGGFASVSRVEDIPLVARRATTPRDVTRSRLHLPSDQVIALATFGGHGGGAPFAVPPDAPLHVVATDYEIPATAPAKPGVSVITRDRLAAAQLAYTDLLAACDVVVTKLGYGIVSECLANAVPLLYAPRGRFAEEAVFVRELPALLPCRAVAPDARLSGEWVNDAMGLVAQPRPSPPRSDGADIAASRLLSVIS